MEKDLLTLYEPINTLKPVDENIWIADGPIVQMAMYRTHIPFTTRMTIIRLDSGGLCHSPIERAASQQISVTFHTDLRDAPSPDWVAEIDALHIFRRDSLNWVMP